MAVSDYVMTEATTGTASSAAYNGNLQDTEDALLELAHGILSGGTGSDGGALVLAMTETEVLLGIPLTLAAQNVALSPSATCRVWAVTDPDDADRATYQVETGATVPDRATMVCEVVTGVGTITSIDNAPAARRDLKDLGWLVEHAAGWRSISVAGGANVTLTADQAMHGRLTLTGLLTANINVVVPSTRGRAWIVRNATTGAYTLTVKTAAGTGVAVAQSTVAFVWCDGTDVLSAAPGVSTAGVVPVASGGTGSTTAAAARSALGAAPAAAQYVTLATDSELSAERTLAAGAGLTLADGGAGAAATLAVVAADATMTVNADSIQVGTIGTGNLDATIQDAIPTVNLSVGAEAADVIQVSVQLRDIAGNNLARRMGFLAWLADSADAAPSATPPDGGWAAGTGYRIRETTASLVGEYATDANGLGRIDITHSGARTWYLHVLVADRVWVSAAVTFA